LFDALDPDTEAALRASIDRFGVLVPIAQDQQATCSTATTGSRSPTSTVFAAGGEARRRVSLDLARIRG
jgi:hypothetical protein